MRMQITRKCVKDAESVWLAGASSLKGIMLVQDLPSLETSQFMYNNSGLYSTN